MKNLLILAILALASLLTLSCTKDDTDIVLDCSCTIKLNNNTFQGSGFTYESRCDEGIGQMLEYYDTETGDVRGQFEITPELISKYGTETCQ